MAPCCAAVGGGRVRNAWGAWGVRGGAACSLRRSFRRGGAPGGGGAAAARLAVVDDHVELVGEDVVDDVVHVDDVLVVELAHDCDLAQHLRAVGRWAGREAGRWGGREGGLRGGGRWRSTCRAEAGGPWGQGRVGGAMEAYVVECGALEAALPALEQRLLEDLDGVARACVRVHAHLHLRHEGGWATRWLGTSRCGQACRRRARGGGGRGGTFA